MVEKLKKLISRIKEDKKSITVFAIVKMDGVIDKWSVILSANWITDDLESRKEIFDYIRKLLIENLTEEERDSIARINLLTENSHLIIKMRELGSTQNGEVKMFKNIKLNGNEIHEAYIFEPN